MVILLTILVLWPVRTSEDSGCWIISCPPKCCPLFLEHSDLQLLLILEDPVQVSPLYCFIGTPFTCCRTQHSTLLSLTSLPTSLDRQGSPAAWISGYFSLHPQCLIQSLVSRSYLRICVQGLQDLQSLWLSQCGFPWSKGSFCSVKGLYYELSLIHLKAFRY